MTTRVLKPKKGPVVAIDLANPSFNNAQSVFSSLFKTAGVKEGDWQRLAFYLAVAGGFVELEFPSEKVGRKQKWSQLDQIVLWASVEAIRFEKPKPTLDEAFKRLKSRPRWKGYGNLGANYQEGAKHSPALILETVHTKAPASFKTAILAIHEIDASNPKAAMLEVMVACLTAAGKLGNVVEDRG